MNWKGSGLRLRIQRKVLDGSDEVVSLKHIFNFFYMNEDALKDREGIMIIAFDGMDIDLIDKYGLENIPMREFGRLDNSTGISRRMTCELFTTFLTGETYEEHGVEGLRRSEASSGSKLPDIGKVVPDKASATARNLLRKNDTIHGIYAALATSLSPKYNRDDIGCETFLEKIEASKPLFVPVWNPMFEWQCGLPDGGLKSGFTRDEVIERNRDYTEMRLEKFWSITHDFWDLVFLHMHDPDLQQDMGLEDLEDDYERLDEVTGDVLEEFGDDWVILFMSDHGKIQDDHVQHNKNAFYSSNVDLFGDETPHIKDFHDKIIEINDKIKE